MTHFIIPEHFATVFGRWSVQFYDVSTHVTNALASWIVYFVFFLKLAVSVTNSRGFVFFCFHCVIGFYCELVFVCGKVWIITLVPILPSGGLVDCFWLLLLLSELNFVFMLMGLAAVYDWWTAAADAVIFAVTVDRLVMCILYLHHVSFPWWVIMIM